MQQCPTTALLLVLVVRARYSKRQEEHPPTVTLSSTQSTQLLRGAPHGRADEQDGKRDARSTLQSDTEPAVD